jgi:hypothetical protein
MLVRKIAQAPNAVLLSVQVGRCVWYCAVGRWLAGCGRIRGKGDRGSNGTGGGTGRNSVVASGVFARRLRRAR